MEFIYEGDTAECLAHYGNTLPRGRKAAQGRSEFATFMDSPDQAAYRWLTGKVRPRGENLLRARYFLFTKKYRVSELFDLDATLFEINCLMENGTISFNEIYDILRYDKQGLFRVLRGDVGMSRVEREKLIELLEKTRGKSREFAPNDFYESAFSEEDSIHIEGLNERDLTIVALQKLIESSIPLAELVLSDNFSDEDRRRLRSTMENDEVFHLANLLNGLCSKKAREIFLLKQPSKK